MSVRILVRCDLPSIRPLHALWRRTFSPIHIQSDLHSFRRNCIVIPLLHGQYSSKDWQNSTHIHEIWQLLYPTQNIWRMHLSNPWSDIFCYRFVYSISWLCGKYGSPSLRVVREHLPICDMTFIHNFSRCPYSVKLDVSTHIILAEGFQTTFCAW